MALSQAAPASRGSGDEQSFSLVSCSHFLDHVAAVLAASLGERRCTALVLADRNVVLLSLKIWISDGMVAFRFHGACLAFRQSHGPWTTRRASISNRKEFVHHMCSDLVSELQKSYSYNGRMA